MQQLINPDKQWYALYTSSRAEKKVAELLQQAGIEVYLPLKRELHQWSDRKKWVETPVINSYLFVCISTQQVPVIHSTKGFVAFVADKGKPAIIPASQIEAMRLTVENKLLYTLEQNTLQTGQTIRITSGPLTNVVGEIINIRQQSKLFLRIPQLGYGLSVDIAGFTFEKIQ